jgi:hypothetical protein
VPPVWDPIQRPENALFPGFGATLLAVVGLRALRTRPAEEPAPLSRLQRAALAGAGAIALTGLLLADGYTLRTAKVAVKLALPWQGDGYGVPRAIAVAGMVAMALLWKRWRPGRWGEIALWDRAMVITAGAALVLCLPVFYLLAARHLPGLSGMRVPARFFAVALLPIAWFAARGVDVLRARLPRRGAVIAAAAVVWLALENTPEAFAWHRPPLGSDLPPVYGWLHRQPDVGAVVELPLARVPRYEIARMVGQLAHWKPLVNGYSGYLAPSYVALQNELAWPLDRRGVELLRDYGVTHIVVSRRPGPERRPLQPLPKRLTRGPRAPLRQTYGDAFHLVYRIQQR